MILPLHSHQKAARLSENPRVFYAGLLSRGFTLMELLLAMGTSAIVLAAIGSVFYSAIRLRERTTSALEKAPPLYQACDLLRRDLRGALPPGGLLAGDFKAEAAGAGLGPNYWVQFSTTTGKPDPATPWGDVQEVVYQLQPSRRRSASGGMELVRSVSRNLLTTSTLDLEDELVLENVESFEVNCFDGYEWRTVWDTSLTETNLPLAVRIRIELADAADVDRRAREPFELVVPLVTQVWNSAGSEEEVEEGEP